MGINLSDYNKAGIFIEERNNSVIDTPAAQEAVVNFIPGFSRKGTVFNRPVLVKTKTDRTTYFGDIDRFLEKKGSYFHRTIEVALQTAPIWALNLLKTTSLDTLNYASVSLSAQYDNAAVDTEQYDSFFNKSGFWQRDTESFLFFAQNSQRMLHFTNVGDKKITVFMFKSKLAGYDITAEVWYGGKEKVPTWMRFTDLISDYMVRVLVVSGDWSNYTTLAADTNMSKYFAASGLRKTKVDDFIRDKSVTLLADYNGSLIPYFRDNRNNNIFIETLINLETDITGLFAAYDFDNVETDFPNGNVDIIGQSLVDVNKSTIDFMSYKDTIEETDVYNATLLNRIGNTNGVSPLSTEKNGAINSLIIPTFSGGFTTNATGTITYSAGNCYINDLLVTTALTPTLLTVLTAPTGAANSTYRIDMLYVDSTGVITLLEGTEIEFLSAQIETAVTGLTYPATYPNNAIVLGYIFRELTFGAVSANTYVPIASAAITGFVDLTISNIGTPDITATSTGLNNLTLTFNQTATVTKASYQAWRRLMMFNELATKRVLSNSIILTSAPSTTDDAKVNLSSAVITDNYSSGVGDKFITYTVDPAYDIATETVAAVGTFTFYYNDDEFEMGTIGLETVVDYDLQTVNYGVVARHSEMYQDFYAGRINTKDFFYVKNAVTTSMTFIHYTNLLNPSAIGDYIVLDSVTDATALGLLGIGAGTNNFNILIQSHPVNAGNYNIGFGYNAASAVGIILGLTVNQIAFTVNNLVATYATLQTVDVYNYDYKVYLKMYTLGAIMRVDFMADNTLITPFTIPGPLVALNADINVYSGEAAYTQTIEIEQHITYTITDTKFLIDLTRYPEVKVGDYIKAYIDTGLLQPGEQPKKFTRILKKTPWSGNILNNVSYAEITTDAKIDVELFGVNDLQTTRYTTIEDYVDTYKAIALGGFTVQATSIPDGTETRQSEILDIIGKNTSLYNAIINKNKFNFRYLIDSFGNGLTEFSKQQLVDITGKRKNCMGFINMPSEKAFKASSSPSFINTDGTLNLEHVKNGGNLEQNPAFLYSFAQGDGKDDGRDTVGYFFPYAKINDNGRPIIFPPAAYVCNTYMRKLNSTIAGIFNWTVAAGTEDGRVLGIANTETDFTEFDLEQMYAMGANPIMYAKNKGFYIETEWTALRTPLSSLSYLHSREVLIDLENDLYAMLLKYQWKFNIAPIRAKIKREADAICQKYVDRSGLYAYKNVIDESNNTPTLIDNQFGLLETTVEIVKAMGVIVNVINVASTGAIAGSTGFQ